MYKPSPPKRKKKGFTIVVSPKNTYNPQQAKAIQGRSRVFDKKPSRNNVKVGLKEEEP